MRWIVRILVAIVLLVLLLCGLAFLLPKQTEHVRTIELHQTPEAIFTVLADLPKMPEWNRNLKSVEMLPPIDGKEATRQTFKQGMTMTIVTTESLAPTHLVREMRNGGGPFAGSWTYELTPTSDGTKVTLTEKSTVENPFVRLMVMLFGATKYIDQHLADLGSRFGEHVRVR